jgi:hypothetical protein
MWPSGYKNIWGPTDRPTDNASHRSTLRMDSFLQNHLMVERTKLNSCLGFVLCTVDLVKNPIKRRKLYFSIQV